MTWLAAKGMQESAMSGCVAKLMLLLPRLWKPVNVPCNGILQETELAEMLEARVNSGKSASTSAPAANGKLGIKNDSIFADLDTDGTSGAVQILIAQHVMDVAYCKHGITALTWLHCLPCTSAAFHCTNASCFICMSAYGPSDMVRPHISLIFLPPLPGVKLTTSEMPYLAGDLAPSTPLNGEAFLFSYPANDKVSDFLSDYLHKIAEAEIISHELVRHRRALCSKPHPHTCIYTQKQIRRH